MEALKENLAQKFPKKALFEQHRSFLTTCTDVTSVSKNYQESVKISVGIPVYNAENYLRQCLYSVVEQSLQEIEIICVNDGSTDKSLEILKEFEKKDRRIIVIDNKESKGSAIARNQMLEIARGEYIGFVGCDDFIDQNFYNMLYVEAKKQNADLARTTYCNYYNDNVKEPHSLNKILESRAHAGHNLNMNDHSSVIWNAIYKKCFLSENNIFFEASSNKCSNDTIFVAKTTYYSSKSIPVLGTFYNHRRFIKNEKAQYYSSSGKMDGTVDINNFIKTLFSGIDFLNSVKFDNENDYITAYKNFLGLFNFRFDKTAKIAGIDELKKLFGSFVFAFNSFKYKDELKNESYYYYLSHNKFKEFWYKKQNPELIISLASYPANIGTVSQVIETLLNQTKKADKVILWLDSSKFPNREADLPHELLALTDCGLTISYTDKAIESFTALVPASEVYPNSIIVTVDDDIFYPQDLVKKLYIAYKHNPKLIHCGHARRILLQNGLLMPYYEWPEYKNCNSKPSYLNFFTNSGGVLYPPKVLHKDIMKKGALEKLAPGMENFWLWVMAVKQGTKINWVREASFKLNYAEGTQSDGVLSMRNAVQNNNDLEFETVLKYYPDVLKKIKKKERESIKQIIFKAIFGKELLSNITKINQIDEAIINLKETIDANMENLNLKSETMSKKIDALNIKADILQPVNETIRSISSSIQPLKNCINQQGDKLFNALVRTTPKATLTTVVISLVEHCNLNCWACDHCAPIAEKSFLDIVKYEKDINRLAKLSGGRGVGTIKLMGGEPLLHPDIQEFTRITRQAFPESRIEITTNGVLLEQQEKPFWVNCHKNNITIVATKYPLNIDWNAMKEKAKAEQVLLEFYGKTETVLKTSHHVPFDITGTQDTTRSFIQCFHANNCRELYNGRLYTCTIIPHSKHFNKAFDQKLLECEADSIDIHIVETMEEILEHLAKPVPFCRFCNISARTFGHTWQQSKQEIREWVVIK